MTDADHTSALTPLVSPAEATAAPNRGTTQPPSASGLAPLPLWLTGMVVLLLIVVAVVGWQTFDLRLRLAETQSELARRLADSELAGRESASLARQLQDQQVAIQSQMSLLDAKLGEAQGQQAALETLYQNLARSRDDWALAEVEQGVVMAAQQLQLAGNVRAAVLALEAADTRLAGTERPQLITVRKAISRDLGKLKSLPAIDLGGMNARLESLIAAVDTFPLMVDSRPPGPANPPTPLPSPLAEPLVLAHWTRLAESIWQEVRSMVRIQRLDRDEPPLLAPGQAFFLRENLKLRLLNARLALLSRDAWVFRTEIKAAEAWVLRYFDGNHQSVQTALASLKHLTASEISLDLPTLNDSLSALRSLRAVQERK